MEKRETQLTMKQASLLLWSLLVFASCTEATQTQTRATENRAETLREKLLSGDKSSVLVVAHRGD